MLPWVTGLNSVSYLQRTICVHWSGSCLQASRVQVCNGLPWLWRESRILHLGWELRRWIPCARLHMTLPHWGRALSYLASTPSIWYFSMLFSFRLDFWFVGMWTLVSPQSLPYTAFWDPEAGICRLKESFPPYFCCWPVKTCQLALKRAIPWLWEPRFGFWGAVCFSPSHETELCFSQVVVLQFLIDLIERSTSPSRSSVRHLPLMGPCISPSPVSMYCNMNSPLNLIGLTVAVSNVLGRRTRIWTACSGFLEESPNILISTMLYICSLLPHAPTCRRPRPLWELFPLAPFKHWCLAVRESLVVSYIYFPFV